MQQARVNDELMYTLNKLNPTILGLARALSGNLLRLYVVRLNGKSSCRLAGRLSEQGLHGTETGPNQCQISIIFICWNKHLVLLT
jgi:hypothetical protein